MKQVFWEPGVSGSGEQPQGDRITRQRLDQHAESWRPIVPRARFQEARPRCCKASRHFEGQDLYKCGVQNVHWVLKEKHFLFLFCKEAPDLCCRRSSSFGILTEIFAEIAVGVEDRVVLPRLQQLNSRSTCTSFAMMGFNISLLDSQGFHVETHGSGGGNLLHS